MPDLGLSRPFKHLSNVDLPEPFIPITANIEHDVTSMLTPCSTISLLYAKETSLVFKIFDYLLFISMYKNRGAPIKDVIIPTGSTTGDRMFRAMVSATSSRSAPMIHD